jgi:hypothetical protein
VFCRVPLLLANAITTMRNTLRVPTRRPLSLGCTTKSNASAHHDRGCTYCLGAALVGAAEAEIDRIVDNAGCRDRPPRGRVGAPRYDRALVIDEDDLVIVAPAISARTEPTEQRNLSSSLKHGMTKENVGGQENLMPNLSAAMTAHWHPDGWPGGTRAL